MNDDDLDERIPTAEQHAENVERVLDEMLVKTDWARMRVKTDTGWINVRTLAVTEEQLHRWMRVVDEMET